MSGASESTRGIRTLPDEGADLTVAETAWVQTEALAGIWVHNETPGGAVNSTTGEDGNAVFTLLSAPTSTSVIWLYVNGILQTYGAGNDFTISGSTITFNSGAHPIASSNVRCTYRK